MLKWLWRHKIRILLNALSWGFLIFATYRNGLEYIPPAGQRGWFTLHLILFNAGYIALVLINVLWLIPRYLFRKKYGTYIFLLLGITLSASFILAPYCDWLLQRFPGVDSLAISSISFGSRPKDFSLALYSLSASMTVFLFVFVFGIGTVAQQYFEVARQKEAIEKQQITAELSLLKSQINPHFLFNVLNSIYSLSLKKSDDTPDVVLKLSDIMRYMLYETRHNLVPLEKEVQLLQDYLDIERIRINKSQQINCRVSGDLRSYQIAPALLITFVENAVKHGTDSIAENAFIRIHIGMQDDLFSFHCINNYKTGKQRPESSGIGLVNTRKRLQLLYGDGYRLVIRNEQNIFEVTLTINMSR